MSNGITAPADETPNQREAHQGRVEDDGLIADLARAEPPAGAQVPPGGWAPPVRVIYQRRPAV